TIDNCHPLWGKVKAEEFNKGRDMARYRKYMLNQVTELLTNYGKIDIVWFDFSYPGPDGKGRDDWDSAAIYSLAKKLQPHIIIDNRLDLNDVPGGTDFITPEQFNPSSWPKLNGKKYAWETCQTFSGSWGYSRDEMSWKSPKQAIFSLVGAVAHGGNLIMNVGPTARGEFDYRAKERLDDFAKWMRVNSRSIYGCTEAPEKYETPEGTVLTWNPETKRLYIHFLYYPAGQLGIKFGKDIRYVQFLHDASEIKLKAVGQGGTFCDHQSGFDAHLFFPTVKPPVEIPVIECFMK
ncbi:MAG: alpha-L-fucosidase, partial [Kiritimatiellae bacterium]|nr:alpha-L-fucosidase [Kiritimatiellia bacterium]